MNIILEISSRMRGGGIKRCAVIAYQPGVVPNPENPLGFSTAALGQILMFCCGPRGGINACPLGARTCAPDSHCAAGYYIDQLIFG